MTKQLLDEEFVGAVLRHDAADDPPKPLEGRGADAYSFFASVPASMEDDMLEGELEEGLEAPPSEDEVDFAKDALLEGGVDEIGLDDHEDLSLAGFLSTQPPPRPSGALPRPSTGSIALGGLLTGGAQRSAALDAEFSAIPAAWLQGAQALVQQQQQQQHRSRIPEDLGLGGLGLGSAHPPANAAPPGLFASLPPPPSGPMQQQGYGQAAPGGGVRAMSLAELEAQLRLGKAAHAPSHGSLGMDLRYGVPPPPGAWPPAGMGMPPGFPPPGMPYAPPAGPMAQGLGPPSMGMGAGPLAQGLALPPLGQGHPPQSHGLPHGLPQSHGLPLQAPQTQGLPPVAASSELRNSSVAAWQAGPPPSLAAPPTAILQRPSREPSPPQRQAREPPPAARPPSSQARPAPRSSPRPAPPAREPWRGSELMSGAEVERILSYQWRALAQGPPYEDDYYYQAFVHRYYRGANRRFFVPAALRLLAPTARAAEADSLFVDVEALGRLALYNVRRPRALMELEDGRGRDQGREKEDERKGKEDEHKEKEDERKGKEDEHKEKDAAAPLLSRRRLADEPALAARVLIEDCHALLLDVQDADQLIRAGGVPAGAPRAPAGGSEASQAAALPVPRLWQRRAALLAGLADSLRLGGEPEGQGPSPDAVCLRLASLDKGVSLLARVLALGAAQPQPQHKAPRRKGEAHAAFEEGDRASGTSRVLWAVLRQLGALFGGAAGADRADALERLALSAAQALRRLEAPEEVVLAARAAASGCPGLRLLRGAGLHAPRPAPRAQALGAAGAGPWAADVLAALFQRGRELGLGDGAAWGGSVAAVARELGPVEGAAGAALAAELRLVREAAA